MSKVLLVILIETDVPRLQLLYLEVSLTLPHSGATRGIGRGIAIELATRGASILGTYTSLSSAHLFDTLSHNISSIYSTSVDSHARDPDAPKLVGIAADITSPEAHFTISVALEAYFGGKLDIVVLNAAVMGLAKIGDGGVSETFVSTALMGNLQFPILLIETLVLNECIRPNGRVIAISSEGVRARRPGGG